MVEHRIRESGRPRGDGTYQLHTLAYRHRGRRAEPAELVGGDPQRVADTRFEVPPAGEMRVDHQVERAPGGGHAEGQTG